MSATVLATEGLAKAYGELQAVAGVDLTLARGEIVALLGENGAGKSTLLKLLSGLERPDAGRILAGGRPVAWHSRADARKDGIGLVPQHNSVIPQLTVRENVWMALPRGSRAADADLALRQFAPGLDPRTRAGALSLGERQAVEFVRVLAAGADILLLDEPTAVLSPGETDDLFARLHGLRAEGKCIVLVTHKIADVERAADRVVVLRRGRVAAKFAPPYDAQALVEAVVGERDWHERPKPANAVAGAPVLRWRGRLRKDAPPSELTVRRGEIVALVGVDGNGQQAFVESLLGIKAGGADMQMETPRAFIPQDRHREGLVLPWSLAANLRIGREAAAPKSREAAQALLAAFDVNPPDPDAPAAALSGGNQQKVIVARELGITPPAWILAFNPSHGLDFRATAQLHARLQQAAADGAGVVLVTMDLDEALHLGDRFGVFFRGRLHVDEARNADRARLGRLMLGEAA